MRPLSITVRPAVDSHVVVLVGELDIATAPELRSTVTRLLLTGHNRIVVDLDGVTFVDAAAVGAVITATCAAALAGGTLHVTHNPRLVRLLTFTCETHRVNVVTALADGMEASALETGTIEAPGPPGDRPAGPGRDEVAKRRPTSGPP